MDDPRWKAIWDACMVAGSFLPALLLGVAFANIFAGIPIDGEGIYQGTLFTLLNPYGLLGGVFFLVMFLLHGTLWLAIKSEGELHERTTALAPRLWLALLIVAVIFLGATWFATHLYDNYLRNPFFFVIPILLIPVATLAALGMMRVYIEKKQWWKSWFASCVVIVGVTLFGVAGLYPNLLPSSINATYNLTAFNSASSPLTLKIMLGVALTFIPVVIAYQIWVYHLFREKVTGDDLAEEESY